MAFLSCAARGETNTWAATRAVQLQYREVDFAPLVWEIGIEGGAKFAKEPASLSRQVYRGVFKLGTDTNQFVPFLWDIQGGKLFLDLNRNRDLTDDEGGLLAASGKDVQLFRGLRLRFATPQGEYQVLTDAHLFEQGGRVGAVRTFLYVRSLWDGAIELGGKRWYVAVIDRPDGRVGQAGSFKEIGDRMILRPWEERSRPFLWWHAALEDMHGFSHVKLVTFPYRYAGNAEVFDAFNLPANLFLQGQSYRLNCQVTPIPGKPAGLVLSLEPFSTPLVQMHLAGDYIRQVVLDNTVSPDGLTVLLDRPPAEVEVPAGMYPRQLVLLQREGFTNVAVGIGTNQLSVIESNVAVFSAGGPLFNRVQARAAGSYGAVPLDYQLVNNSNLLFHLVFQRKAAPPMVEIRQGDNLLAKGAFEFG